MQTSLFILSYSTDTLWKHETYMRLDLVKRVITDLFKSKRDEEFLCLASDHMLPISKLKEVCEEVHLFAIKGKFISKFCSF